MNQTNILVEFEGGRIAKYDKVDILEGSWVNLAIRNREGINLNRKVPTRRIREICTWHAEEAEPFSDPLYTATRMRRFADIAESELDLDGEQTHLAGDALAAMRQCAEELEDHAERRATDA